MTIPAPLACANCRFFQEVEDRLTPGGDCRRFPPRFVDDLAAAWPGVKRRDWCGEFAFREA